MKLLTLIKKSKLYYYISNGISGLIPKLFFEKKLQYWIKASKKYPKELIEQRVNYYCSFPENTSINESFTAIKNYKRPKRHSVHYFDLKKVIRYFNGNLKIDFKFGDVTDNQDHPKFLKSRPIDHNGNSVLLKLNALRHFNFIKDKKKFEEKEHKIVWRGVVHKENRKSLLEKFLHHPLFDVGSIHTHKSKLEWIKPYLSKEEQLKNKFIFSIEGVDVATNLKWIMSSNSLCFMPKPKFETWYMEGLLVPNFHYVLIKDDYSDVEELMNFYTNNPDKANIIIKNAQEWTNQFRDKELEKILSILVANKYFKNTNQL